jgi:hypothetical protein
MGWSSEIFLLHNSQVDVLNRDHTKLGR